MNAYEGKNVVITGGSSGLGLATAELLVARGARVLITGRDKEKLETARQRLGVRAVAVRSDSASMADVEELPRLVRAEFDAVDALFVNAGVTAFAPFEAMSEAQYDELFAVNTKGPYFTVQKLAPLLRAGAGVVLTTSVANVKGLEMISAYAATKAALRSMTRSLAQELLHRQVRVNAVSPGPIATGILEATLPPDVAEQTKAEMIAHSPMQRFGEPAEVAATVAYLAFDATFTTGAEIPVDGGATQL
ncbi:SDR family oxidoreductase [Amycolatopsis sp. SID8362]|uniref:SDR family oxidoreductase n=1 Tax=Amycolatopsis sp. SID8362 TaxID=2690346 RepID=UPI00136EECC9|nr:SDR family oxidoreductase [Amycolatopsis sp. SID8362]NBH03589.1 SDR family oxidoreductase [Amycolatopsis sp. SID8362]NED40290.1 SDR family oxidoreductase [Amycolatopsis sp. SID8362]